MAKLIDGLVPIPLPTGPKWYEMPADRFRYMYFVMLFLGIGTLWPYNMIISVNAFFEVKYPGINTSNIIPMILQFPSIFILFVMIRYGAKASFTTRLSICFSMMAVITALIPYISSSEASWSFLVLAIAIFLLGICVAVIQSTSLSLASKFPPIYMQSVMTGQGIAGMCVCFVLLLIKYILKKTGRHEGYQLFIYLSAFISLIALLLYIGGLRTNYSKYFLGCVSIPRGSMDSVLSSRGTESGNAQADEKIDQNRTVNHRIVLRKIWKNGLLVALVFIGTFLMFPAMTFALRGFHVEHSWFGLLLVTTFNIFDTVGRFAPGFITIQSTSVLWVLVGSRFVLYPFFIIHKAGAFDNVTSDILAFALVAILAVSNGYLASFAMMKTTSYVEKHEEEASSAAMAFFLVAGILFGLNLAVFLHIIFPAYL